MATLVVAVPGLVVVTVVAIPGFVVVTVVAVPGFVVVHLLHHRSVGVLAHVSHLTHPSEAVDHVSNMISAAVAGCVGRIGIYFRIDDTYCADQCDNDGQRDDHSREFCVHGSSPRVVLQQVFGYRHGCEPIAETVRERF